jgi:uncharacterized delta-60 repeat protein
MTESEKPERRISKKAIIIVVIVSAIITIAFIGIYFIADFIISIFPDMTPTEKTRYYERANAIALDGSGNIYVTGYADSNESGTVLILLKYNSAGELLWYKLWSTGLYSEGNAIAIGKSGNIYIAGETTGGVIGLSDISAMLIKFDSSGNLLWNKTWLSEEVARFNDVALDNDENIYVLGQDFADILFLKYNSDGDLLWDQQNMPFEGNGFGITLDSSDNIYLTGYTNLMAFLLKYDSARNLISSMTRVWRGGDADIGYDIAFKSSGDIYITGTSVNLDTDNYDCFLLSYNSSGYLLCNITSGGVDYDYAQSIALDNSGNLIVVGGSRVDANSSTNLWLQKLNASGSLMWSRTWGGDESEGGSGVVVDAANNIYATGVTYSYGVNGSDILLLKYDSSGTLLWNTSLGEYAI